MTKLIKMNNTNNDSDKYAVIVDGLYQLVDTAEQAQKLKEKLSNNEIAAASLHGIVVLKPYEKVDSDLAMIFGEPSLISEFEQTDLIAYQKQKEQKVISDVMFATGKDENYARNCILNIQNLG